MEKWFIKRTKNKGKKGMKHTYVFKCKDGNFNWIGNKFDSRVMSFDTEEEATEFYLHFPEGSRMRNQNKVEKESTDKYRKED